MSLDLGKSQDDCIKLFIEDIEHLVKRFERILGKIFDQKDTRRLKNVEFNCLRVIYRVKT